MTEIRKGDRVDFHSVIGGPVTLAGATVECEPFEAASGDWVTFISGQRGYVAVEALTPAQESEQS